MVFFKYLANILQQSSLNGWFHEDSENKTANVFSLTFASFHCSYGDISMNALWLWWLQGENMCTINFIFKVEQLILKNLN